MFGLGMPEILLILAIALIVIGPKKLPELAKTLGRAMGEFKRSAQDFKDSLDVDTTLTDVTPKIKSDLKDVIKESTVSPTQAKAADGEKPKEADVADAPREETKEETEAPVDTDAPKADAAPDTPKETSKE